jgi:hypothetical protein
VVIRRKYRQQINKGMKSTMRKEKKQENGNTQRSKERLQRKLIILQEV